MKKFKVLVLFIMIFILSGCTLDYNTTINSDGTVKENVIITFDNNEIDSSININDYLDERMNSITSDPTYSMYTAKKNIGKENSSITFTRKYSSLLDYKSSPILQIGFNEVVISDEIDGTSFKTIGNYNKNDVFGADTEPEPTFDKVTIKYKFMNDITNYNSTIFDKDENTITYELTEKTDEFYMQFKCNNSKRYDIIIKEYLKDNIVGIIISALLIVTVIVIISVIRKKSLESNRI